VVIFTIWLPYPWEETQVAIEKEAGWVPEPVWAFRKRERFIVHTGI
jgi:hypothetical protein